MTSSLAALQESILDGRFKGYPQDAPSLPLKEASSRGWRLLEGELGLPALVLRRDLMDHNRSFMREFLAAHGAALAPHGKTTMCPQLFARQLEDGAVALTVATACQARVALVHGFKRLVLANEVVHPSELAWIQGVHDADGGAEIRILVDSHEGLDRLEAIPGIRPFPVMLEMGLPGARAGVRSMDQALELARRVQASSRMVLCGLECFEALGGSLERVDAFLQELGKLAKQLWEKGLFDGRDPWITAGGSAFFDRVARVLKQVDPPLRLVLRSGCYLTHDAGLYRGFVEALESRTGWSNTLRPALELWAQVLSRPEPGLAILNVGKRDLPYDAGLPVPEGHAVLGEGQVRPVTGWRLGTLYDQHVQLLTPEEDCPGVGDLVQLGLSHPCTAFDKWPLVWLVDESRRVEEALRTFF